MERIEGLEDFFGAGADQKIIGKFDPADFSQGVEDEFGGAGDVGAAFTGVGMEEVPATNERVLVIAEEEE